MLGASLEISESIISSNNEGFELNGASSSSSLHKKINVWVNDARAQ